MIISGVARRKINMRQISPLLPSALLRLEVGPLNPAKGERCKLPQPLNILG